MTDETQLKILIADDEPLAAERLQMLLAAIIELDLPELRRGLVDPHNLAVVAGVLVQREPLNHVAGDSFQIFHAQEVVAELA